MKFHNINSVPEPSQLTSDRDPVLKDSAESLVIGKTSGDLNSTFGKYGYRILLALRQIIHALDSYSRRLAIEYKITGPQLMCLYSIVHNGNITLSTLGKDLSLSPSTVNGILDRLEAKNLITRERKDRDRRKVILTATMEGVKLIQQAPLPLQKTLLLELQNLSEQEQASLAGSLEQMVQLMYAPLVSVSQ
jgi:DNA-binding MarR family transcriptional regulator